jgi:hypothetical protein
MASFSHLRDAFDFYDISSQRAGRHRRRHEHCLPDKFKGRLDQASAAGKTVDLGIIQLASLLFN